MYGFPMGQSEGTSRERLLEAVFSLYNAGFLTAEDGAFRPAGMGAEWTQQVREAQVCLRLVPGDEALLEKLCYWSNPVLVLENAAPGQLRITQTARGTFGTYLEESLELLPCGPEVLEDGPENRVSENQRTALQQLEPPGEDLDAYVQAISLPDLELAAGAEVRTVERGTLLERCAWFRGTLQNFWVRFPAQGGEPQVELDGPQVREAFIRRLGGESE